MRQPTVLVGAKQLAKVQLLLLILLAERLVERLLRRDLHGVFRHTARLREEPAARRGERLAPARLDRLGRKLRGAANANARPLRREQRVRRLNRRRDALARTAELASRARSVDEHHIAHTVGGKLQKEAFLHARKAGDGHIFVGIALSTRGHAGTCEYGEVAAERARGLGGSTGELNIGRLDGNERLGGADDRASAAGNAGLRVDLHVVVADRDCVRDACFDAFATRRMAVTHRHATLLDHEDRFAPQRLGNIGYVRKVRHFGITAFRGPRTCGEAPSPRWRS